MLKHFGVVARLAAALSVFVLSVAAAAPVAAQSCQYMFGFAALHNQVPAVVGDCTGNEVYNATGSTQATANGQLIWRRADNWIGFTNGYLTWVNSPTGVAVRLNTQRFAWEPNTDGLSVVGGPQAANSYLDDRSHAAALMLSLVNALNRREYLRAYSYWEAGAQQLPTFAAFEKGYATTAAVLAELGLIRTGVAAGNLYASVPVVLVAQTTNGATQTFVGCYNLHLAQPANQATPPFRGWAIQSAAVKTAANTANHADLLAKACPADAGQPVTPIANAEATDVSANHYLDDRSTAQEVLRSLVNALNRHEYLRAYGYWQPNAAGLASFADFEQGYADTASVALTLGTVTGDAGAGQLYYNVPAALVATSTGGEVRTYVACYTLHLSQPSVQGTPPYQPLAIRSATVKQVANTTNLAQALTTACQPAS
jgi:hypothetical protein